MTEAITSNVILHTILRNIPNSEIIKEKVYLSYI